jgi:pimeloyl-ACP methyl ester carboxylesterase
MNTVVLVHGAFHGAWCWKKVENLLRNSGIETISIDLPGHGKSQEKLTDLYGDALAVRRVLEKLKSPVVLCGHSYGGAVITEAVNNTDWIKHLVYLAALVPKSGRSISEDVPEMAEAAITTAMEFNEDGSVSVKPLRAEEIFYNDCTQEDIAWAVSKIDRQGIEAFTQPLNHSPWKLIDSTYIICKEDNALPLSLQERLSSRCRNSVRLSCGHSPMISQPDKVVKLLSQLASS